MSMSQIFRRSRVVVVSQLYRSRIAIVITALVEKIELAYA